LTVVNGGIQIHSYDNSAEPINFPPTGKDVTSIAEDHILKSTDILLNNPVLPVEQGKLFQSKRRDFTT